MDLELPKQYNWTKKDQDSIDTIYIETRSYLKWFLLGLLCGILILGVIYILKQRIGWWAVSELIGVFVG